LQLLINNCSLVISCLITLGLYQYSLAIELQV
jgi:hypothetical protein